MAQVGGVLMLSKAEQAGKLAYFTAIDGARFRRPVVPGDQLRLEVELLRFRSRAGVVAGKAFVGDQLAAEAELMFALVEVERQ
jgi:3-hydroxyacyl-[acyl-carrier-protein] dehydratase